MFRSLKPYGAALAAMTLATVAHAASDPVDDFLATYTGGHTADLDIVSATVRFDGTSLNLAATMNGSIGLSPGSLYVWGIDRGAGTARLNAISTPALDPMVRWDAVAVMLTDGTLRVVTFPAAGAPTTTTITGAVSVAGSSISAAVPFGLLPSRGRYESYDVQLWSRMRVNPLMDGFNSEIADFGPRITADLPEPASWAMMILGFGLAGWTLRRPHRRGARPAT